MFSIDIVEGCDNIDMFINCEHIYWAKGKQAFESKKLDIEQKKKNGCRQCYFSFI